MVDTPRPAWWQRRSSPGRCSSESLCRLSDVGIHPLSAPGERQRILRRPVDSTSTDGPPRVAICAPSRICPTIFVVQLPSRNWYSRSRNDMWRPAAAAALIDFCFALRYKLPRGHLPVLAPRPRARPPQRACDPLFDAPVLATGPTGGHTVPSDVPNARSPRSRPGVPPHPPACGPRALAQRPMPAG